MTKTDAFENGILRLIFQNDASQAGIAAIGSGLQASSTAGSFYIGLSTGTLTDSSDQSTTQAAYGSYARVAVARSSGSWSISGSTISNVNAITFPQCTSGSESETYFGIGTTSGTGAGNLLYWGALTSALAVSSGITPSFVAGALTVTED